MESERGPLSPWLPVGGEVLGLGFLPLPRAGSLYSVWSPVSWLRVMVERGRPFVVPILKCYRPNWLLGCCVLCVYGF